MASFLAPWNDYVGIGVDSKYLWVYRSGEIACATHWSVKRCVDAQGLRPAWMTYTIPESVRNYNPVGKAGGGLVDLWPCEDGTLTAAFSRVHREMPTGINAIGGPLALLHDGELLDEVPAEPHDRPVNAVVTPSGGLVVLNPR